jgi:DNA polymerase-3 subunit delta'
MPLSQVQGQERAVATLLRALAGQRLHHAYLFAGPDGVGKTLAARGLAEALLCHSPAPDRDACGRCNACLRSRELAHPDLHVLRRKEKDGGDGALEQQIKIEQVRELQQTLSYKGFEGSRRVVLILEAERMNPATSNALLKTLEEPGPDTHFVLVSAVPHLLLPTILSRCQRVRFAPLDRGLVAEFIAREAEVDRIHADLLAGLAEGSIGKGLALADSALLTEREALIGRADDPDAKRHIPQVLELAEELAGKKAELPLFFQILRTWYRDLLLVHAGVITDKLVHRDLAERLRSRAAALSQTEVLARLERINETERGIEGAANARLSLETLLLRLAEG